MSEQSTPRPRPRLTISEAAKACGVHRDTIARRIDELAEHGAVKDDKNTWTIPVEALLAVGLKLTGPKPDAAPEPSTDGPAAGSGGSEVEHARQRVSELERQVVALEHQLEVERVRREASEQLAAERLGAIEDARVWRRMLEPPQSDRQQSNIGQGAPSSLASRVRAVWSSTAG